ncbi:DUF3164 family protein [Azonexus sp.]|uniref:DUF3164 family protein n=1 Tax=Azonexus sp. TaxID=1872668 RepID=UPI0027B98414|nr:DUF3164 family protein [Azonexus sp.]
MQNQTIPAGYRKDAQGRLVPESLIGPIDRMRDDLVLELAKGAEQASADLAAFKQRAFADVGAFVSLSAEKYGVKRGGNKGNVTLHSFDGRYRVSVAVADRMVFDERLQAAKHLIDECIIDWSQGSRDEIKALVQSAFDTDKEGKINVGRVLALRRLDIKDEKWQRAMQAVSESLQVVGSTSYVRFHKRVGETDKYEPIPLDVAAV